MFSIFSWVLNYIKNTIGKVIFIVVLFEHSKLGLNQIKKIIKFDCSSESYQLSLDYFELKQRKLDTFRKNLYNKK